MDLKNSLFGLNFLLMSVLCSCASEPEIRIPPPYIPTAANAQTLADQALTQYTDQLLQSISLTLEEEVSQQVVDIEKTAFDTILITISGDDAFRAGHARLNNTILAVLDKLTQILVDDQQNVLQIISHTDNSGSEEINQDLSEKRATAVASHLQRKGLANDRISSIGRGESEPVVSNEDSVGQSLNRRLEFYILATPN